MSQFLGVVAALAAGVLLGTIYFGGLWLTVRRLTGARNPALMFVGSYFLRGAAVFAGLLGVALTGGWQLLLVCLAGLMAVRLVLVRRLQPQTIFSKAMNEKSDKISGDAVRDEEHQWS
jgi:F1F0 ATPase subunit 2